jgi:uncharacterized protein YecE (DUF72 family)
MPLWIGTSGWQYRHWRGRLYPTGMPQTRWFDRYVEVFDTVELNVTFYRQPKPEVFEAWARRVPDRFVLAVKASRFLTHIRRLRDPQDSVDRLMEGASRLGRHLGPILIQLPPDMEVEVERLDETLAAFPTDARVTVEPRHRSWFRPEVMAVLERHRAALCWADRRGPLTPERETSNWGYLRFHGGRANPRSCYGEEALQSWVDRVRLGWPAEADVYAYFNNDHNGCAPRDAAVFGRLARNDGLEPTRTPPLDEVPVG